MMKNPTRVLLIEDNPGDARLIWETLSETQHGSFDIQWVTNLKAGLEQLAQEPSDVILLDLFLSDSSGLDTFFDIHAQAFHTPIILLTGLDNKEIALRAVREGAQDYLVKGEVSGNLLARAISYAIERKRAEEALKYRLEFENLITVISTHFINLPTEQIDEGIHHALQTIGEFFGADRGRVLIFSEDRSTVSATHEWCAEGIASQAPCWQELPLSSLPWTMNQFERLETLVVASVAALPFEAAAEKAMLEAQNICSLINVPLVHQGVCIGFLDFHSVEQPRFWPPDVITLLKMAGEMFVNALQRKEAEDRLRQFTNELQTRNRDLDAFASMVAHDLRQPLGPIVGYAELLEIDYASLPPDKLLKHLRLIAESGRKMGRIIDALLLLARAAQMTVELVLVNMGDVVGDVLNQLGYMIQSRRAQISLPECWPLAMGHIPLLEQVWVNYLSNALKYGGSPPCLELGFDIPLQDATSPSPPMARFWLHDNGPGIASQDQARLFNPFIQVGQDASLGHGLGLYIVQRIVNKLGGQVGVESEPGQGSTFFFTLPLAVPPLSTPPDL